MNRPQFTFAGRLGGAHQFVWCAGQEISARLIFQCPTAGAVIGNADLEATSGIAFFRFTEHIAEGVDREVLGQVRSQVNDAWNGIKLLEIASSKMNSRLELSLFRTNR